MHCEVERAYVGRISPAVLFILDDLRPPAVVLVCSFHERHIPIAGLPRSDVPGEGLRTYSEMIGSFRSLVFRLISDMIVEGLLARDEKRCYSIKSLQPAQGTSTVSSDRIQPFVQRMRDSKATVGARDHVNARTIRKRSLPDPCRYSANVAFATPKAVLQHDAEMSLTRKFAGRH
jgi:hypothetical protein